MSERIHQLGLGRRQARSRVHFHRLVSGVALGTSARWRGVATAQSCPSAPAHARVGIFTEPVPGFFMTLAPGDIDVLSLLDGFTFTPVADTPTDPDAVASGVSRPLRRLVG